MERVTEGAKFREKSHIVKHWMEMHQDSNIIPKFRFKVIISYKECLSHQLGEALAIWTTKDTLLNSKCEYISNCISRITVQEGALGRKKREIHEEEDVRVRLEKVKEFKKRKEGEKETTNQPEECQGSKSEQVLPARRKLIPNTIRRPEQVE